MTNYSYWHEVNNILINANNMNRKRNKDFNRKGLLTFWMWQPHDSIKKKEREKIPLKLNRTRLRFICRYRWVEAQVGGLSVVLVRLGTPHDVGKRQLPVLLHCGEAKVLAAEEEQGVEEDNGGVRTQLFAVPQKLFLHTRMNVTCREEEGKRVKKKKDVGMFA